MPHLAIGVSCNSRVLGIAAIGRGFLSTSEVKLFSERWSDQKPKRIVQYLDQHVPVGTRHLAVAVPPEQYTSAQAKAVIGHIKRLCQERSITPILYEQTAIHTLCGDGRAKKKLLMHKLSQRYPELVYCYERELRNKQAYYVKLFEAVAAAMLLERHTADLNVSS